MYRPAVERNLEILPMPIDEPPVPPGPYRVRRMTVVHADGRWAPLPRPAAPLPRLRTSAQPRIML